MSRPITASINASSRLGNTRKRPASTNSRRSTKVVLRSAQPCAAAANAASPSADFAVIRTISIQEPSFGSLSSKPMPCGSSTNTNGTRKAGSVYFQACSVVLYGSPPVMAAAANGDSAVGGDTSDSTGVIDHDRGELEPQPGQRHHADDDAGRRASGCGGEHAGRAVGQRAHQLLRRDRGLAG